ncbi:MAG: serine/threonine-protein kinase [Ottowia sp.]|nr:serine/threonine protein kinase [Ottowia sp.]
MTPPKVAPLPVDTIVGGYRVLRKISSGGFGLVYLAHDSTGQPVAIKEYLPSALVERAPGERVPQVPADKLSLYHLGLKNFFEEGRALAQIAHPAVVGVMDFFRENETVYMVMNYLDGATLQDYVVAARKHYKTHALCEETIRSLFDEILRGLRVVHQHRMLHLDLKPANIIITEDNRAVMLDFGAARQALTRDPGFTRPMYTQGFAAPEMYGRKTPLGPWTDIYAMGACMYSSMTGAPPMDAKARRKKDTFGDALARLSPHYSAGLLQVVAWTMALDPAARPQSVFELLKRLSAA